MWIIKLTIHIVSWSANKEKLVLVTGSMYDPQFAYVCNDLILHVIIFAEINLIQMNIKQADRHYVIEFRLKFWHDLTRHECHVTNSTWRYSIFDLQYHVESFIFRKTIWAWYDPTLVFNWINNEGDAYLWKCLGWNFGQN